MSGLMFGNGCTCVNVHGDDPSCKICAPERSEPPTSRESVEDVLRSFGWECGPEFHKRYLTDRWVFSLVNIIERLTKRAEDAEREREQMRKSIETYLHTPHLDILRFAIGLGPLPPSINRRDHE